MWLLCDVPSRSNISAPRGSKLTGATFTGIIFTKHIEYLMLYYCCPVFLFSFTNKNQKWVEKREIILFSWHLGSLVFCVLVVQLFSHYIMSNDLKNSAYSCHKCLKKSPWESMPMDCPESGLSPECFQHLHPSFFNRHLILSTEEDEMLSFSSEACGVWAHTHC